MIAFLATGWTDNPEPSGAGLGSSDDKSRRKHCYETRLSKPSGAGEETQTLDCSRLETCYLVLNLVLSEPRFCLYVNDAQRPLHHKPQEAFNEDCVQGVVQAEAL